MTYILNSPPKFEVLRESNWSSNKELASKAAITTMAAGLIVMLATVLAAHGCVIPHHGMASITDLAKYKFILVAGAGLTTIGALSWLYLKSQKSDAVWAEKCQEMIDNPDFKNFLNAVATTLNQSEDEKAYFSLKQGDTFLLYQEPDKANEISQIEMKAHANLIAVNEKGKITFKIFNNDASYIQELSNLKQFPKIEIKNAEIVEYRDILGYHMDSNKSQTDDDKPQIRVVDHFSHQIVKEITGRYSSALTNGSKAETTETDIEDNVSGTNDSIENGSNQVAQNQGEAGANGTLPAWWH